MRSRAHAQINRVGSYRGLMEGVQHPTAVRSPGLSSGDVVNRYIGLSGGYLGVFRYRTDADLYLEYCDRGARRGTR